MKTIEINTPQQITSGYIKLNHYIMENLNIKNYPFPEPSKGWLKSYCEQMKVKPNTEDINYYGKIRNITGGLPEVFKIYSN